MASEFKHLEFLPLDEENLVVNDDPESNLKSKACLNLGFIGLNTVSRLRKISNINKTSQQGSTTFLDLTYALENTLANILTLDCISNPQHTAITEHYKRRNISISANKILPSFGYCQNLTFTGFKTWGGLYGTVSYYINLLEDYEEYYTPSEISYYATRSLLDYSKTVSYNAYVNKADIDYLLMSEFYDVAKRVMDEDTFEADKKIYNLSKNIILSSPLVKEIHAELRFLSDWIPKLFQWYKEQTALNINLQIMEAPSTNEQKAINTLLRIFNSIYENGFNQSFGVNIAAKFIKQTVPSNLYDLLQAIGEFRANTSYVIQDITPTSSTELLVVELMENISKFRASYDYLKGSNIILETFAPPGGYALFLVALAAQLINRAYIISYKNTRNTENIFLTDAYKRVNKLLGYAGILLIKTSLPHAQLLGVNILKTFKLFLSDIDPNNLLDI